MSDPQVSSLRRNVTLAEQLLWEQLRRKRVADRRFRRQFRIGAYIVDFVCPSARLIVEVDGPQHDLTHEHDRWRTQWLESQGFRVIRFWNSEVMGNLEGVVWRIETEVSATPSSGRRAGG